MGVAGHRDLEVTSGRTRGFEVERQQDDGCVGRRSFLDPPGRETDGREASVDALLLEVPESCLVDKSHAAARVVEVCRAFGVGRHTRKETAEADRPTAQ